MLVKINNNLENVKGGNKFVYRVATYFIERNYRENNLFDYSYCIRSYKTMEGAESAAELALREGCFVTMGGGIVDKEVTLSINDCMNTNRFKRKAKDDSYCYRLHI